MRVAAFLRQQARHSTGVRIESISGGMSEEVMTDRNHAVMNGALMALGALAVVDNIVAHWILELHRAVPGPHALEVEWALVIFGAILFIVGLHRERRARR